nr:hypothetical protein [Candidatus Latescibacterota bacterium]NIO78592.1 hypothetical protein [Candidatus Latescibacterota bacterium]
FLTADFLKTGYHASGAYCRLDGWARHRSWYCEYCDEYHPNNNACPHECGECGNHVNWDYHAQCQRHYECFDASRSERCRTCEEEIRAAEEERKKKEEEAKASKNKAKKKAKKKTTKKKAKKKASKRSSRRAVAAEAAE